MTWFVKQRKKTTKKTPCASTVILSLSRSIQQKKRRRSGIDQLVRYLMRQIAQSVELRTLEAEVRGTKPVLGTWWWGGIPPNQPYPKGAAQAATTLLAVW